jgi:hypothetical protein
MWILLWIASILIVGATCSHFSYYRGRFEVMREYLAFQEEQIAWVKELHRRINGLAEGKRNE